MRRITVAAAAALAAAAFTAAPAGAQKYCDPGPCLDDVIMERIGDLKELTVEDVVWAVRCAGYALGGNPCYGS